VTFFGIDPGGSGAIAAIEAGGRIISVERFSKVEVEGGIALLVADFLERFDGERSLVIEKVASRPGEGVVSVFSFGRSYGEAIGAAVVSRCLIEKVSPQRWQRDFGLLRERGSTDSKTDHKRAVKQAAEVRWSRKFLREESDAVWLAEWARLFGSRRVDGGCDAKQ
tara:strand:+ start:213 stop:710 length:498 start_codon:yes stop_codon:yes gene_type:complete